MQSNSTEPPEYGAPITLAQAKRVMQAAEAEAEANQWPMVIAIIDSGGHLVMLHKRDCALWRHGRQVLCLPSRRPRRGRRDRPWHA